MCNLRLLAQKQTASAVSSSAVVVAATRLCGFEVSTVTPN